VFICFCVNTTSALTNLLTDVGELCCNNS